MIITFNEAIEQSAAYSKRHAILGNGFSIACRADIFHYGSLFDEADFSSCPEVKAVFSELGTQDFEAAIRALEGAAKILPAYVKDGDGAGEKMRAHASALKEILVKTIASNHPATPSEVSDLQFNKCRIFLANFLGQGGQIFTLNYDLLLYWTLMHDDDTDFGQVEINTNDGFGNDEDDPDADYVVWQGEVGAHNACVHFLHGALHLFDSGSELKKYTWVRTNRPLIEQIREAINVDTFPVFVSEGSSDQKKKKIRHNAYLYQGYKQLTANAVQSKHCFFIFGHSLAENDDHILNRLARGRFAHLFVGIYGDPDSDENKRIRKRAYEMTGMRHYKSPMEVTFFDAGSAEVWG
ncbi:DUF4917 family protein [Phenylobacterium sp.]|uniref:DUF4917 family protein n=1 Tax=Phenylobacterium sp. TaxID=1871053 RepID=UPI003001D058